MFDSRSITSGVAAVAASVLLAAPLAAPAEEGEDPSYKVVAPPVGATVESLPKDAKESTIDGTEYYEYAGTYYQVFHSGSKVVYMVVKNPNA